MVTQAQIAEKLGISRQLVTFALAGYPQVAKESRKRILATALEMGYRPNPHARALLRKKNGYHRILDPRSDFHSLYPGRPAIDPGLHP